MDSTRDKKSCRCSGFSLVARKVRWIWLMWQGLLDWKNSGADALYVMQVMALFGLSNMRAGMVGSIGSKETWLNSYWFSLNTTCFLSMLLWGQLG